MLSVLLCWGEWEAESCPQDWLMFGSSCYYISSQRRSWDDSRKDCVQRDADLVIINNRQEQVPLHCRTLLLFICKKDKFTYNKSVCLILYFHSYDLWQAFLTGFTVAAWVGMTDREKEGTWIWVDGTPVNRDWWDAVNIWTTILWK